eukprot:SAG31_NODE_1789_length_7236_cov_7.210607_8_plen_102_part_00
MAVEIHVEINLPGWTAARTHGHASRVLWVLWSVLYPRRTARRSRGGCSHSSDAVSPDQQRLLPREFQRTSASTVLARAEEHLKHALASDLWQTTKNVDHPC